MQSDAVESNVKFNKSDLEYLESDARWTDLGLGDALVGALLQRGYKRPSKIQNEVIRMARHSDVVAQAQNGSGKTLAYLIPCISRLQPAAPPSTCAAPQAIIVADTCALIQQISKILRSLLEGVSNLEVCEAHGRYQPIPRQCGVLIATIAQVRQAQLARALDFSQLRTFVVDEADHVFEQDLSRSFLQLFFAQTAAQSAVRFILSSATMTPAFRQAIEALQERRSVIIIEKAAQQLTLKNVAQYAISYSTLSQKNEFLDALLRQLNVQSVLVFDNRKSDLVELCEFLRARQYKAEFVFKGEPGAAGDTPQEVQRKIDDFLAGKYRIMLTTNLLARGIDMRKVTLVINFSLPRKHTYDGPIQRRLVDVETYLHRVGRTGRFGDHGIAVNFVGSAEERADLEAIKEYYGNEVKEISLGDVEMLDRQLKEIDAVNSETRTYIENNI